MQIAQITCINKGDRDSRYTCIARGGGKGWSIRRQACIDYINNKEWRFYVEVAGDKVWVEVIKREGREYIKTENDGDMPNNLLSLPECSS